MKDREIHPIEKELLALLNTERTKTETPSEYVRRLCLLANKLSDTDWEKLSGDAQNWINRNLVAIDQQLALVRFDGNTLHRYNKNLEDFPGQHGRINRLAKIQILSPVNPKKPGSKGAAYWELYQNGMTIEEAIKAGIPRRDINWNSDKGFIRLV